MKSTKAGFTLVEIMIVAALVGMLAAIALPSFMRSRTKSQTTACINNLRQIEAAKEQWAMENRKTQGAAVLTNEIDTYMKKLPSCPAGGTYNYTQVGSNTICSVTNHSLP